MRVLWVSGNAGDYKKTTLKGTGGWVGAMQRVLTTAKPDLELGILFCHPTDDSPVTEGNVTYLPTLYATGSNALGKLYHHRFRDEAKHNRETVLRMVEKVRAYNPDVIHVWGLENFYAGVLEFIHDIPTVVHIQGLTCAYTYTYTPPCYSRDDLRQSDSWLNRVVLRRGNWYGYKTFERRAANELRLAPYVNNWIGRTEWDKTMAEMQSPGSRYFHCDEMMRGDFFGHQWHYHYFGTTLQLQSSVSQSWYKGMDVILKTADLLKRQGVNVCWHIYGWTRHNTMMRMFERRTGVNPDEVGVVCHGNVDGETIRNGLLSCDAYVHPSYIENSSNAIAEAQLLGVPVVAQLVGGNATMLKEDSGILVAPNEPYIMAAKIMSLRDERVATGYSERARQVAYRRHDKDRVISDLLGIYQSLKEQ